VGSAKSAGSDIGLVGAYDSAAPKYAGLFHDDDGAWNLFDGLTSAPFSTDAVDKLGAGYNLSTLNLGQLNANMLSSAAPNGDLTLSANGTGRVLLTNAEVVSAPTSNLGVANKLYVDGLVQGFVAKQSVVVKTTANITCIAAGSGPGKTLSAGDAETPANQSIADIAATTFDNVILEVGDRVLVAMQTASKDNGIYVVTTVGDSDPATGSPWVLTRATDADNNPEGELTHGAHVFVDDGDTQQNTGWVLQGPFDDFVIDINPQIWVKFSKDTAVSYTAANIGSGMGVFASMNGTQFQFNSLRAAQTGGDAGLLTIDDTTNPDGALTYKIDQSKITGTGILTSGSINWSGAITTTGKVTTAGADITSGGLSFINAGESQNAIVAKAGLQDGLSVRDDIGTTYMTFDTDTIGDGVSVNVVQPLKAMNTLAVAGASTFSALASFDAGATVAAGLTVEDGGLKFINALEGQNAIVAKSGLQDGLSVRDDIGTAYMTFDTDTTGDGISVNVAQALKAASSLAVTGATTLSSTLQVAGFADFDAGATVAGGLTVEGGSLTFSNAGESQNNILAKSGLQDGLSIRDDLATIYMTFDTDTIGDGVSVNVVQPLKAMNTLAVAGASTFSALASFDAGATVAAGLTVEGGGLTFSNAVEGQNGIVAKAGLQNGLSILDDVGTSYMTFDTDTMGDGVSVNVTQALKAASTLAVTGAATLSSTLQVAGLADFDAGATVAAGLTVESGGLTFSNAGENQNAIVAKAGLQDGLSVRDDIGTTYMTFDTDTIGDGVSVNVTQALKAMSTLAVAGASTFSALASFDAGATVAAGLTVAGGGLTFSNALEGQNAIVAKAGLQDGLSVRDDIGTTYMTFDTDTMGDGVSVNVTQALNAEAGLTIESGNLEFSAADGLNKIVVPTGLEEALRIEDTNGLPLMIFHTGAANPSIDATGTDLQVRSDPAGALSAVSRKFIDDRLGKAGVRARSTENIPGTFTTSFVGTLTGSQVDISTLAASFDGVSLVAGDRVLLMAQTATQENGIYSVYAAGSAAPGLEAAWVLRRVMDANSLYELRLGSYVFVGEGSVWKRSFWAISTAPSVMNTTPIEFIQVTSPATSVSYSGDTGENNLVFPDNLDSALELKSTDGKSYLRAVTTDDAEKLVFDQSLELAKGIAFTGGAALTVPDSTETALTIADGSRSYIAVDTLNPKVTIYQPHIEGSLVFTQPADVQVTGSLAFYFPFAGESTPAPYMTLDEAGLKTTFGQKAEYAAGVDQSGDDTLISHSVLRARDAKDSAAARSTGNLGAVATYTGDWTYGSPRAIADDAALFDGVVLTLGARVLLVDQTDPVHNGIFTVADAGGATAWRLVRADDSNTAPKLRVGNTVAVSGGALWAKTFWICTTYSGESLPVVFEQVNADKTSIGITELSFTGAEDANGIVLRDNMDHALDIYAVDGDNANARASYLRFVTAQGLEKVEFDQDAVFGADATVGGALKLTGTGLQFNNTNSGTNVISLDSALADGLSIKPAAGGVSFATFGSNTRGTYVRNVTGETATWSWQEFAAAPMIKFNRVVEVNNDSIFNGDVNVNATINAGSIAVQNNMWLNAGMRFWGESGSNNMDIPNGQEDALSIRQGSNPFLTFDTVADKIVAVKSLDVTGMSIKVTAVSASTTLNSSQYAIRATAGVSDITLTLPDAATNEGRVYKILKVDSGAGAVNIVPSGADTIELRAGETGTDPITLTEQGDFTSVTSYGAAGWYMH
jgi:hypothetical protein